MAYDFVTLSPDDFENLAADLLSKEWGVRIESFKPGKDSGIDLRNSRVLAGTASTVVQCKRYAPHKFKELCASIKKEKAKLERIRPQRYVLVTSVALSPSNKDELMRRLSPWCTSTGDIYGASEVNGLLRDHPEVENNHFKLWVSSTAVLERVLHSRIFNITQSTLESTADFMSRLVMHDGFNRALEMLRDQHHVLVVGNPGIGKTTLARVLLCHYLREGFEPVCVMSNIDDAWDMVHGATAANRSIVIFYDDFLGRLKFDSQRFEKNEEHSMAEFLRKVRRSPNLRLILTTREYILADARRVHGAFDSYASEILKYTLSLADYSRAHRAKMLFNHLYFSDLPDSRLERLVGTKVYQKIVSHEHFNPRVVETVSKYANSRALNDEQYVDFIEQEFDNPAKIWEHPFRSEISPTARQILALLWSFGGIAELESLKSAALRMGEEGHLGEAMDFTDAIRQLDGNFVSTNKYQGSWGDSDEQYIVVEFQNPSVEELVEGMIISEPTWLRRMIRGITQFSQVEKLASAASAAGINTAGAQFWTDIHATAIRVRRTPGGRLINYRRMGEEVRKAWEVDPLTQPREILVLLQLSAKIEIAQQDHSVISAVRTKDGWIGLMSGIFSEYLVAPDLIALMGWLTKESKFSAKDKVSLNHAFREAVLAILRDSDELIVGSLSTLRILAEMVPHKSAPMTLEERSAFASAAKWLVTDIEENSEERDDVFTERDELSRLESICDISLNEEARTLDRVADHLAERPERDNSPDPSPANQLREDQNFDIDALFASLLDR